jgi:hypothetical protein
LRLFEKIVPRGMIGPWAEEGKGNRKENYIMKNFIMYTTGLL